MLSLDSVASRPAADEWARKALAKLAAAGAPAGPWAVEPKLDGLAVRLSYANGALVQAATRGDGKEGEDVTSAVGRLTGAPRTLAGYSGDAEVVGEAYMTHAAFAAANEDAAREGRAPYSNTRNLAAASLRAGATAATARSAAAAAADRRALSFAAYAVTLPPDTPNAPSSHSGGMAWLRDRGVGVPDAAALAPTLASALDAAEAWMAGRGGLPYDVDGAVIKADSLDAHKALGVGPQAPRWALALKFPGVDAVTRLARVTWQLGRTGQLVPVADLDPVSVGGVVVARASLHNVQVARRLGARVGDAVVVRRAGDVVPQVVAVLAELRSGDEAEWGEPTCCPACGGPLAGGSDADGDALRCEARECAGRALRRVQHFAATVADGVGPATVEALVDAGVAADAADFIELEADAIAGLPGFGPRRASNIVAALQAAKGAPPATVLAGLAIPGVGPASAAALVARFGSIRGVLAAGEDELQEVDGVGPATAAAVAEWCAVDDNAALAARVLAAGVGDAMVEPSQPPRPDGPLSGLVVVVSGTVPGLTRETAKAAVAAAGGTPATALSARTSLLVVGAGAGGAKLKKAASLGVRVVKAANFFGAGAEVVWEEGLDARRARAH
jgi:DNA ligase (NAD+)